MSGPIEYEHKESVLAEKVVGIQTVVTIHGVRTAADGDYIVYLRAYHTEFVDSEDTPGQKVPVQVLGVVGCDLVDGGEFEMNYTPKETEEDSEEVEEEPAKAPAKKTAAKRTLPAK
jgi:hypothetical protein